MGFFLARCVIFGKAQLLVPECTEQKCQVLQTFPPSPAPPSSAASSSGQYLTPLCQSPSADSGWESQNQG